MALPSPETLALIATALAKGGRVKPATAIACAAQLYDAACEHLEKKARSRMALELESEDRATIPHPDKPNFPASFDDFLRLIVKAKTPAVSTQRFREYLRDFCRRECGARRQIEDRTEWAGWAVEQRLAELSPEARSDPKWTGKTDQQTGEALVEEHFEKTVDDQFAELKRYGFSNPASWYRLAKQYRLWWDDHKSEQARAAARKRIKPVKKKSNKSV